MKNNLKAEETVFINANLANVRAAVKLGIQITYVQPPLTIRLPENA
jgi:FMN phosphatase YigB (HAD superfamily)